MAMIFSDDYETLPVEPIQRWLSLRDLVERRLTAVTDEREGISEENLVEYCTVLVSAAEELKLWNSESFSVFSVSDVRQAYPIIRSEIISLATKLSMRYSNANTAYSVILPRASKVKLYTQIERLRSLVTSSDLAEQQKRSIFKKLDELHTIIVAPRADLKNLMIVLASIAAGVFTATSFLADAPDALATISAVIGEAKEAEEEEQRQIEAERKPLSLPDLRQTPDTNDEIPF